MTATELTESAVAAARSLTELPVDLVRTLLSSRSSTGTALERSGLDVMTTPIDWAVVAPTVDASGLGPLFYNRMQEIGVADRLEPATARAWDADLRHAQLQCAVQRDDALDVSRGLTERGIRHAFIKGFITREWLYEPTWVRAGADSDILIAPADIELARDAMYDIGFVQASRTEDFRGFRPATEEEILGTESSHYELAQFARIYRLNNQPDWMFGPDFRRGAPSAFELLPDGPVLYSVIDVHWALHFMFAEERPLDSLTLITSSKGDFEIPTLSIEWHILFTSFKLYFEAFERPGWGLHMLVDLAALISEDPSRIDWDWIDGMVTRYGLQAALFYTTSAAQRLLGAHVVPREVLDRWSEIGVDVRPDPNLDFGDFLPYVLQRRTAVPFMYARS